MAYTALNLGYTPAAGYEYTATTDSQADWGSVPNDTYFFDFDTRQVYYKDNLGGVYGAYAGGESVLNTYNASSSQWSKTAPATILTAGSTANGLTFFRDDLYASELTLGGVTGTGYVTATGLATSTTGSGTGMTVDIVAVGGDVTSVTINNPGFGYTLNDVITILQGGSSNDETATVTDLASDKSNPVVASATLDGVVGTGYVTANNVPTTGGTGVGLTFDIVAVGGNITSITINDKGNNYTEGDVVTIVQGGGASDNETATLTVYAAGTTPYDSYNIAYGLSIVLSGTSGTANISFDGGVTNYTLTFNTDLFTTAQDWEALYGDTLRAINIRPFVLGSGADGRLRFCASRTNLLNMTITNLTGDLSGTITQEFTGGSEPKPDHLLIPYVGKPYFGKRIQHYIRVNFNVNTGAVKYANLQLRRYANDSVIGSAIPVQRYDGTSGITGQQHNFVTYTASPVDSFVLGGFYFALENVSNADWTIQGAVGILVQNVFDTEISF
jgi:hypothetical protein